MLKFLYCFFTLIHGLSIVFHQLKLSAKKIKSDSVIGSNRRTNLIEPKSFHILSASKIFSSFVHKSVCLSLCQFVLLCLYQCSVYMSCFVSISAVYLSQMKLSAYQSFSNNFFKCLFLSFFLLYLFFDSISITFCPYLSVPIFLSLYFCPYLSVPISLSISFCHLFLYLSLFLFLYLHFCFYFSVSIFLSLFFCLYFSVSIFLSLSFCLSIISFYIFMYKS